MEVKSEELKIGGRRESQQKSEESISLCGYLILHSSFFTLRSSLFTFFSIFSYILQKNCQGVFSF